MSRHFPIFIDVATVPPLVVGAGDSIEAKIRLLRKFSPQIDLVTDGTRSGFELSVPGIRRIAGVTVADSQTLFGGRPLIIIDTADADQWKRSLRMSPPAKQSVLSFQRSWREAGARE